MPMSFATPPPTPAPWADDFEARLRDVARDDIIIFI